MKIALIAALFGASLATAAFAGSSTLVLTPPVVSSWDPDGAGGVAAFTTGSAEVNGLNAEIANLFSTIQNDLNTNFVGNFHDLTKMSQAFSNANTASFDNASLLGYQTYDLFAVSLGVNAAVASPTLNPFTIQSELAKVKTEGDVYVGGGTSGIAGQAGLNAGFLVPNLYLTGKLGFVPSMPSSSGLSYQQSMVGIGANYTVFKQFDLLIGFLKWRGLSVGTGLTYNSASINANVPIDDQSQTANNVTFGSQTVDLTVNTTDTKAKLKVTTTSLVIPFEAMTSLQFLWFLNVGLGAGVDLAFSKASISVGGDSGLGLSGVDNVTYGSNGSADLVATNSKGSGAVLVPRLAASLGVALGIVKLDVPVSFYPTTKAFAVGVTGAVVW